MNRKFTILLSAVALTFFNVSCESYLDTTPDNRTELDSEIKIAKILVSAYPNNYPDMIQEQMSDNTDESAGTGYSSFSRFQDQAYAWEDITETDNEDQGRVWSASYMAITNANQALDAIGTLGNPASMEPYRGEALICRAYAHFILVNMFCLPYNEQTSGTDLGVPYMEKAETTLNPTYERGNVAEVYAKIEKDIEAALPLLDDNAYAIPKYHFNRAAAYAFATRFYLYYRKYDKVIECANAVLGVQAQTMLRDWKTLGNLPRTLTIVSENYAKDEHRANLLLATGYSSMGVVYGAYTTGSKYRHHPYTSQTEMIQATAPWGAYSTNLYYVSTFNYDTPGSYRFVEMPRYPYLFEYTDPVAGVGYTRSIHVLFTADETLLSRAEAYVMKKDYNSALEDMNLWLTVRCKPAAKKTMTADLINTFYTGMAYYKPLVPTIKKELHPSFAIETGQQENFIQCLLHMNRIENYSTGLRWNDIKRFGIVIYRRSIDNANKPTQTDVMEVNDPRRAIQLPADVINAGLTPNPR